MKIDELLEGVEVIKKTDTVKEVTGIIDDSRKVKEGYLFAALKGESYDGHDFCKEAINKGAIILLVEKEPVENIPYILVPNARKAFSGVVSNFYGNPSVKLKVMGVTGTNGKTTTSYLLSSLFPNSVCFSTVKYIGVSGNIKAINTTPSPILLHKEMAGAYERGLKTVILEVSSIGLDQDRVSDVDFDYAIFTNITRDHLDYHKNFENYLKAKAKFFESLKDDKIAVINADDPNAPYFIERTKSKVVTFGFKRGNILGEIQRNSGKGLNLRIEGMGRNLEVMSPLVGSFNARNILAAASVGILEDLSDFEIGERIASAPVPPGRLEKIKSPEGVSIFVDYAHTPDALFSVLSSLKEYNPARIITVFGAGGHRDKGKRGLMGAVVSAFSDVVIVTSDNPRDEKPDDIIDDIFEGISNKKAIRLTDRKEAIFKALSLAEEGDYVLIAGKGHEDYQEIKGKRIPFSDKKCVKEFYKYERNRA
jgi:UDP-N-acetylmuramoyl-L-alanyl-D-glutamate--2,6-diaminopimelate ligase